MTGSLDPKDLARLIDSTLLKADATRQEVETLCAEARAHGFRSVVVSGSRVSLAYALLEESEVKVATMIAFPVGTMDADAKRYETEVAVDNGVQEIEVVINLGRLKDGDTRSVRRELLDIVEAAEERPVGALFDAHLLTREEKILACNLAVEAGAKFVGPATGFGNSNATLEDVKLVCGIVGPKFGVKATGLYDAVMARALIEAGAVRLGTSVGPTILRGL